MARPRHTLPAARLPADPFALHGDFSAQLHDALKHSPWWMLSIVFHVVVAVVLSAFTVTGDTQVVKAPIVRTTSTEDPFEQELDDPEDIERLSDPDPVPTDPTPVRDPVEKPPEMDTDSSFHETFSLTEDTGTAQLVGPGTNDLIGTGADSGGAFPGRGGDGDGGGTRGNTRVRPSDDAVLDGLRWLAAHQSPDGSWGAADFTQWCDGKPNAGERPDGAGAASYDVGVSGLALCAFLGAGYTNRGDHEFAKVVRRGLAYLRNCQDPEGCFGPRSTQHYIYNHATAALAMVEAYGMTESTIFKNPAQKALDFLSLTRNPYFVWRYGVKPGDNDTSVTGWMMMALKSAKLINEDAAKRGRPRPLTFDEEAFDGIRSWLDKVTDPDYGRVGYVSRGSGPARPQELVDRFPAEKSESMTAVGVLARIFMGDDPRKDAMIQKGLALMSKLPPTWNENDGSIDMYYWYYATLAVFQAGGATWKAWDAAMSTSIVANQHRDGTYCGVKGSWDPVDPWGPEGGRVYSTALLTMCLEVYYRYDKVIGAK